MKKILTLILILTYFWQTNAQQNTVLQDEGVKKTIVIDYKKNNRDNAFENRIIELIQKSKGGDINDIKLTYDVKEYRKITKYSKNITLWASVGNLVLQGEYKYLKFPINDLLIPSQISFVSICKNADGDEIDKNIFKKEKFKSGADLFKKKLVDNGKANDSKLRLDDVKLYFSQKDFEKFSSFVKAVDDYYDVDARLNMINQELDKIRVDTLELLDEFYAITKENEAYFDKVKAQRLKSKLNLKAIDPIGLNSHFGKTQVRNREIKKQIEYTQKNMHETYYKKGLDHLKWNNEDMAKSFFLKSVKEKNNYAPPFYELANIDFKHKNYEAVLDSCASILNTKKPDNDTRYNVLQLIEKVMLINIDKIKELAQSNLINLALEQLNYCTNYVKNVEGIRRYPEFDEIRELIYTEVYNSLAKTAKEDIENNELKQAKQDIDSLINFREKGEKYYINPEKEQNLLRQLHAAFVTQGKKYLQNNKSDSALVNLTQAKNICIKYQFVACDNQLTALMQQAYKENYKQLIVLTQDAINENLADSAISLINTANKLQKTHGLDQNTKIDTLFLQAKQLKYNGLITEGEHALNGGDGQQALAFFDEAEEISQLVKVNKDKELPLKKKKAGVAYILAICSQCETYVEALQLNKAQSGLNMSRAIEKKYSLQDDEQASQAINKLAGLLKQGQCNETQHEFNIKYGAANRFVEKLDFENAKNSIEQAKRIAKNAIKCKISTKQIDSLSNEIHAISVYQKQIKELNEMVQNKDYSSAISSYKEAMKYYADSVKNNFGINCDTLFAFVKKHKNNELINYAVVYYTELSEPDIALDMLNELYGRNYIASWSKESQNTLGACLADRDFSEDEEIDPKRIISDYTHDLFWFKYMKKAYLSRWKNLKIK